jgi:aromatic ring-opening dioxygenase catalytic subunit (LigB family)
MTIQKRLPTLFIPHGGGPCFFMEAMAGLPDNTWDKMAAYLRDIGQRISPSPKAVLVISAHWETEKVSVLNTENYQLLYDYYGFPEHTYHLTYPAHGSAQVAARVTTLLNIAGIANTTDSTRGLDHGVFIPFKLIYPDADLPIVQLSLLHSLDPAAHLALGKALAPLRDEGVLIVGSGLSYHNLRQFFTSNPAANEAAAQFDAWLTKTISAPAAERAQSLTHWQNAPGARDCHPRSEHLIPLMVVAGAAEEDIGFATYQENLIGKQVSGYQFGGAK